MMTFGPFQCLRSCNFFSQFGFIFSNADDPVDVGHQAERNGPSNRVAINDPPYVCGFIPINCLDNHQNAVSQVYAENRDYNGYLELCNQGFGRTHVLFSYFSQDLVGLNLHSKYCNPKNHH